VRRRHLHWDNDVLQTFKNVTIAPMPHLLSICVTHTVHPSANFTTESQFHFLQVHRVLKPDGLFLACMLAGAAQLPAPHP
jgi:hypothetical protein